MKKKFICIAIAAMSLVSFNSFAQTSDNSSSNDKVKCERSEKQCRQNKANPYEGLTLSDAQKQQLEQLDSKRKAERKQKAEARKAEKKQNAEARKADRQQNAEACKAERRASRKAYLEEVKAIVGPEQYVLFLENIAIDGGARHHGDKAHLRNSKADKAQARGDRREARAHKMQGKKGAASANRQARAQKPAATAQAPQS